MRITRLSQIIISLSLLLYISLISCINTHEEKVDTEAIDTTIISGMKSSQQVDFLSNDQVNSTLEIVAEFMDSIGYMEDTALYCRFREEGKTFLNLGRFRALKTSPEESQVSLFYQMTQEQNRDTLHRRSPRNDTFSFETFSKAVSGLVYFYKEKKPKSEYKYDGYIEEWIFSDSSSSISAAAYLTKWHQHIYFNSCSYILVLGERLYIVSTRASMFCPIACKAYKYFLRNLKAKDFTNSIFKSGAWGRC